jgi:hypothetical protein
MSKIILALGAAALAISAPVIAKQGGDKGHGGGAKAGMQKAERGPGNGGQMKGERGKAGPAMRVTGGGRGDDQARGGGDRKIEKARGNDRIEVARGNGRKDDDVRIVSSDKRDLGRDVRGNDNLPILARSFGSLGGRYDNCPPGLDKKDNGCMPPGQARKYLGAPIAQSFADKLVPNEYRRWYRDDEDHFYRSSDDYIYRVSRSNNLIDGLIPLFGGGGYYAMGDQWPQTYDFYNVPYQYRNYYGDTSDYRYRFGDGAIYRINSGSGVVDGIVALLAGDLGVGSKLPLGYDTYNVPFAYRDRYADTADNWYRYNDGYIYQVDPKTRLISAVIDALI